MMQTLNVNTASLLVGSVMAFVLVSGAAAASEKLNGRSGPPIEIKEEKTFHRYGTIGDIPYVRKPTWRETINNLIRESRPKGKPLFSSPVLIKDNRAIPLSVDVTGKQLLVLVVSDEGGNAWDHAAYVNARLIDQDGHITWLDEVEPVDVFVGRGTFRRASNDTRNPVVLGTTRYHRYIRAYANSGIVYKLDGRFTRFEALAGNESDKGSLRFIVDDDPRRCDLPKEYWTTGFAPFWRKLMADFPERAPLTMAVRSWLRQDKLHFRYPDPLFLKAARARVNLADKSLAYVKKAGADVTQFEQALKELKAKLSNKNASIRELYLEACLLRRKIIFSHPALSFDRILINVNPPTSYSHNGDQFLARHSRRGKGLLMLTDWKEAEPGMNYILEGKLPAGAYRSPDLHYDAERVLFAFADHTEERKTHRRFFIYEATIDGRQVRQVTGTGNDPLTTWGNRATVLIEDNDPCYLPDGDIIFLSTRGQSFGRCHGPRYNPAWVLHRCDPEGTTIRQLSFNNENEVDPIVMNDGRIAFTRWEYTDRHETFFHKLWWCRPDGTSIAHLFGNDMTVPHQFLEVAAIPNSHKVVAIGLGHHSFNTGTIVVIDPNISDNGEKAITHVTPETSYSESKGWPEIHYSHPYPITEDLFLASRAGHPAPKLGWWATAPDDRGIYLIDMHGGRELIYEDPDMASFSPIPIRKRKRPMTIPSMVHGDPKKGDHGTVFLQNAYLTRNDPEGVIKPGMIKALRVIALGVLPRNGKEGVNRYAQNNIPKKILGTVPVNEDGSAFFKVPARTSIQLQTLDENGMAILTERSFFYLQPGENRSCVGCHEPYGTAPVSAAFRMHSMEPKELKPPAGPQYKGGFSYTRTVQPVLDRYCISCHGLGGSDDPKARKINLTGRRIGAGKKMPGDNYTASYAQLAQFGQPSLGHVSYTARHNVNISRPRDFYAYRNKVSHMLLKNHGKCNMDEDSRMRIIEWMDMNYVFFGDLFPNKLEHRRLTDEKSQQTEALRQLIRTRFGEKIASQPLYTLINKVQVDESRILMAPLAGTAGGWEQIKPTWKNRKDPDYLKMRAAVDACIIKQPNENTNGWEPTHAQGAAELWVREARGEFRTKLNRTQ